MRNYARSGYNRISRELEREIREKERARVERERINMREQMVIREDEGNNGKVAAEADASRLCNYFGLVGSSMENGSMSFGTNLQPHLVSCKSRPRGAKSPRRRRAARGLAAAP